MQLQTQLTINKTQVDRIGRLEYNDGIIKVYFSKTLKIGDEEMPAIFDISNPVTLDLAEIQTALDSIFTVAFNARTAQLSTPADGTIVIPPDYRGFYNELITTSVFALARQRAGEDLEVNAAYTDFALALSNAVNENSNPIALQICLDKIIIDLGDTIDSEHLTSLANLFAKYKMPIMLKSS